MFNDVRLSLLAKNYSAIAISSGGMGALSALLFKIIDFRNCNKWSNRFGDMRTNSKRFCLSISFIFITKI